VLIVLIGRDVFPAWMVAAIVARELLVSGLRLAALERGAVLQARDVGSITPGWHPACSAGARSLRSRFKTRLGLARPG
jgi:phosphatidylglycerophosphate synthase